MTDLYLKRRLQNWIIFAISVLVTLISLFFLFWILKSTIQKGLPILDLKLLTQDTPAPGSQGGLKNAITGSLLMIVIGILIGTPVGILAGTFLAEFGAGKKVATTIRFFNDVLLSTPSIITGLFIYSILVVPMKHFSALAGALSLALIALPIIVRTTDEMLKVVPTALKEAALALGAPRWKMVTSISYRAAAPGILTGILLAISRISGETAPLLFTALSNQFSSLNLFRPIANLPVIIFQFAMSPYNDWKNLAWAGSLIAVAAVLSLSLLSRLLLIRGKHK